MLKKVLPAATIVVLAASAFLLTQSEAADAKSVGQTVSKTVEVVKPLAKAGAKHSVKSAAKAGAQSSKIVKLKYLLESELDSL